MNEAEAFTTLLDWLSSSGNDGAPKGLAAFIAARLCDALLSERTGLTPRERREAALAFLTKVTARLRELVDAVEVQTRAGLQVWPQGDLH